MEPERHAQFGGSSPRLIRAKGLPLSQPRRWARRAAPSRASVQAELEQVKAKLAEAQAAGKLKRFFRGLDPAKIQVQVARTEGELGTVHRTITAGAAKLTEFQAILKKAQAEEERCANEAYALLSQQRLDATNVPGRIAQLSKQADELTAAIRAIEAELEALLAKILREAKVIATSLTKATISKQMDDQKFDVVVVDEVSMAPMPSLYFAAGRASQKAIVVGDFRQLPPIVLAETELAQKWLGRDIFNQAGVERAVDEQKPEARLTMLRRQYRMHPEISRVPNNIIYGGRLVDCLSHDTLGGITSFLARSPFAATPLVLYDVSSTNPWSSRLDQGGRYNLYSAVLSAELARRAAGAGICPPPPWSSFTGFPRAHPYFTRCFFRDHRFRTRTSTDVSSTLTETNVENGMLWIAAVA